ncbi:hypothetical protein PCASD_22869 [Puccinia coronata f. sp. avenae]|uniref:Uncharacterized protein n=1 Tax=Puccinia coronata f. sp. avenae TaxID=200324 RepID=A0A2N5SBR9_9BASI|nr:hypothetical protein PCASD_22869 [Puccinia coronata f. sp. avenae]
MPKQDRTTTSRLSGATKQQADRCPVRRRGRLRRPVVPAAPTKLKPLKDAQWPAVDEERLAVFSDPLRKDEIKPIRQHEWEQIVMASDNQPNKYATTHSKHTTAKAQIQQLLLQLAPSSQSPITPPIHAPGISSLQPIR